MTTEDFMIHTTFQLIRFLHEEPSYHRNESIRIWVERLVICYTRL